MISLSSSASDTRSPETDRRARVCALGAFLALASSWFNLHLARPFALLVTGCLSIIPSTLLRNLSSTQWSALFPFPSRWIEPGVPFCCFSFFFFFFEHVKTAKCTAGEAQRENCRKTMAKVRGKNGIFDDGFAAVRANGLSIGSNDHDFNCVLCSAPSCNFRRTPEVYVPPAM